MDERVGKKRSKVNRSKDFMDMPPNDEKDPGHSLKVESDIEKKQKHKDKKRKCSTDEMLNLNKVVEENSTGMAAKGQDCSSEGDAMRNGEENNKSKRKKRKKGKDKDEIISGIIDSDNKMQFLDDKQERKAKKRKNRNDSIPEMQEGFALESRSENNEGANTHSVVTNNDDQGKKIKKRKKAKEKEKLTSKGKIIEDNELRNNGGDRASAESHESDPHLTEINMGDAIEHASSTKGDDQGKKKKKKKMKKKSKEDKRVTFSDQVEVFNDGLVQGKRFTKEEDEKIKEAIYSYIDAHGLGDHDQGVDMILHCSSYPKLRGCWKEIASALPHRPLESVYHRGHILFERDDSRKWTLEELEIIRKFHEKHGPNWKMLADAMGKHRFHVKDAWRRIKLGDVKKGHWSQDEYQKLFNLVNADLSMRALEETRKSKHGMLRDNICWEAIGNKVATRTSQLCCMKWYEKLTSPMVAEGEWADTDDYRLLNALLTLDACSMEEVEWDHLLEHRSGDVCRKRWNQMVQHIGEHGIKSFSEQVEILSQRYCPDLVEAREAFDSKPVVP
ncbi:hypothetical protein QN277_019728 [Acacia crassicarpa]|uniref:Myb-like domain-containing protein n=1 Tax=Acacia crassicarpa TaxID=499986 RepID=A0AAE1KDT0_9FABA|nr:hypothetical protein QN277_019728 [Acacia crassicarpa]